MILVRAAMWVEQGYWPEQVRTDRSVYRELADQFEAGMQLLMQCAAGNLPGGNGSSGGLGEQRFAMINVHGWTSVRPPFGVPEPPLDA